MRIAYWSDYACPYCYIGEVRLKKALASLPEVGETPLLMRAFQLDPTAHLRATTDTQTRFAHKYGISLDEAALQIEAINQMGRAEGLDFHYASTRFTNTLDAHRVTKLAWQHDPQLANRLTELLYEAYFVHNLELANHEVLYQVGVEAGVAPKDLTDLLDSTEFLDAVRADQAEAAQRGIHAVPAFLLGPYTLSGAQSVEVFAAALRGALQEESAQASSGERLCGPDGCRLPTE